MVDEKSVKELPSTKVLGVKVSTLNMDETVDHLIHLIEEGKPNLIATADSSGLVIAQEDPELKKIYQEASLVTCDSYGVVWAIKKQGAEAERVSGVDVADRLLAASADKGYRVYFLGADHGVAEVAAERVQLKHPGCHIVGTHHGFFPESDFDVVAQEIAETKPDILFVAFGIPRQEKFIRQTMHIIQAKVAVGVGGSLDVFSGKAKRAPVIIQKLKLEWLWRTLLNPKKMKKAMALPKFMMLVLRHQSGESKS